jgi:predicted nucleic acid-binding protein
MKVLLDTSVLVAAMIESHERHAEALPWLQKVKDKELEGAVAAHSLAELYAVLTALPLPVRISGRMAWRLIRENISPDFKVVTLSATDYRRVLRSLSSRDVAGGAVYDALIAQAAAKAKVDHLVTLNPKDFQRVWPEGASKIRSP